YERSVGGEQSDAERSRRNSVTAASSTPSASTTRYGTRPSVTPSTRPALGTTNVSTFRSCSATASAPRLVTKADDLRSQHNPAPAGEGRNGVIRSYWLPSATYRRDSRRTLTSVSSVNRTPEPRLEPDMSTRRGEVPPASEAPQPLL